MLLKITFVSNVGLKIFFGIFANLLYEWKI